MEPGGRKAFTVTAVRRVLGLDLGALTTYKIITQRHNQMRPFLTFATNEVLHKIGSQGSHRRTKILLMANDIFE